MMYLIFSGGLLIALAILFDSVDNILKTLKTINTNLSKIAATKERIAVALEILVKISEENRNRK